MWSTTTREVSRLAAALLALALPAAGSPGPANLDFEQGEIGEAPPGWVVPAVVHQQGYRAATSDEEPYQGAKCAYLTHAERPPPKSFGNLMRTVDAAPYRGKRLRFEAAVRIERADLRSRARLWMRVDRPSGIGFFDNMDDRKIGRRTWQRYRIEGDVAEDAETVNIGLLLSHRGTAWIDAVTLEVVGDTGAGDEPARALTTRGRANLEAFARLYGYLRYFHPSDQAADADWDALAIAGVQRAEPAADGPALAEALRRQFSAIAPTVRIFAGDSPSATAPTPDGEPGTVIAWRHVGLASNVEMPPGRGRYTSSRERFDATAEDRPDPGDVLRADLGGGVRAIVPLALPLDGDGKTVPAVEEGAAPPAPDKPAVYIPSGDDRAARLAAVIQAWNVLEHSFPYFDVAAEDWPGSLGRALEQAATDRDGHIFVDTLRRLIADLDDGHGGAYPPSAQHRQRLPLVWAWIEGQLAVTAVAPILADKVVPGDVVVAIDGRPAAALTAEAEALISGASPGWKRWRAASELASGPAGETVELRLRKADGTSATVTAAFSAPAWGPDAPAEERPETIAELRPGVFYVDLDRIDSAAFRAAVDDLATADGIVFDLRGYPRKLDTVVLAHLAAETLSSARWHTPEITRPHRRGMTFRASSWDVEPAEPRIAGKVAFLTDGRAISYAETYLGIVEHYRLGAIVGEPTAGTNGDVNVYRLVGGYRIAWTGMKVLKHDGSRHHGVGIRPSVPVTRTLAGVAAGRDEVLDAALELLSP